MKKTTHQEALEELTQTHDKSAEIRPYELTAIAANLTDTEIADFIERVKKVFATHAATIKSEASPMRARLAYAIKKTTQGVYFFIRFSVIPGNVKQIMRDLSLMPEMLRSHVDSLNSFEETKAAAAPVAGMTTSSKPQRGWTKREEGTEEKSTAVDEKPVEAPIAETKNEDKATIAELDKRLDEILGKSN